MIRVLVKRLSYGLGLLLAVLVLNFLLIRLAPGDPADYLAAASGGASEEFIRHIRSVYGLDKPVLEQLWIYIVKTASGDLGMSYHFNVPVLDLFLDRAGPTILLIATAASLALLIGTSLGVLAARRPNSLFSSFVMTLSVVGYAAPAFWTGLLLLITFSYKIDIFPMQGMYNISLEGGPLRHILDVALHLVLPAITLAIIYIAQYSRLTRASMLEVLSSDYVRTARAKGLGDFQVSFKHALRNAILPVITITGLHVGSLLSGAVLVEAVFHWPGLGTLAFEAILRRDYPVLLGMLLFSAVMVVIANLLTDLCYAWADPRVRAGGRAT